MKKVLTADAPDLEQEVDGLISGFDTWFQSLGGGNDPLNRPERAVVKTFFWYLLKKRGAELTFEEREDGTEEEGRSPV